jgi:hypothetical protein
MLTIELPFVLLVGASIYYPVSYLLGAAAAVFLLHVVCGQMIFFFLELGFM